MHALRVYGLVVLTEGQMDGKGLPTIMAPVLVVGHGRFSFPKHRGPATDVGYMTEAAIVDLCLP